MWRLGTCVAVATRIACVPGYDPPEERAALLAENIVSDTVRIGGSDDAPEDPYPRMPEPISAKTKYCFKKKDDGKVNQNNLKKYYFYESHEGKDIERCLSIYIPPDVVAPMPVVLTFRDLKKDDADQKDYAEAFGRYRFANVLLTTSTDDHAAQKGWHYGADGVMNYTAPMPCSANLEHGGSHDLAYVRTVLRFLELYPDTYDSSNVALYGYKADGEFAGYAGFCLSGESKLSAIIQNSAGLTLTKDIQGMGVEGEDTYGRGGVCKQSDFNEHGEDCAHCVGCEYWPIYPCYSKFTGAVYCGLAKTGTKGAFLTEKMYTAARNERYVSRMVLSELTQSDDLNIQAEWATACGGITKTCIEECETSFLDCMAEKEHNAGDWLFCAKNRLVDACQGCSPTMKMLAELGEAATEAKVLPGPGSWGPPHEQEELDLINKKETMQVGETSCCEIHKFPARQFPSINQEKKKCEIDISNIPNPPIIRTTPRPATTAPPGVPTPPPTPLPPGATTTAAPEDESGWTFFKSPWGIACMVIVLGVVAAVAIVVMKQKAEPQDDEPSTEMSNVPP